MGESNSETVRCSPNRLWNKCEQGHLQHAIPGGCSCGFTWEI
ncbi:hypothetical protein TELCIR_14100 [Teladorsagia circumcincta]|uniref:Uncharacterized protein n=1 Tax=Teladorsagia circumcincta TaxID=45464 RepID=A0A2G9U297_TELCI|nr:hypothetical protein TELCIR_14100 [Teladorsagia circumcincta]